MIENVVEWLIQQVEAWGCLGIFIIMFVESTFVPFPSEVAMLPAGYLAYHGRMDPFAAVFAGILGSIAGAYFNYSFARLAGLPFLERYGRYFFVPQDKLHRAMSAFRRHGEIATFVCRMIPVVRQLISVPAGLSGMNAGRFGFYTGLGAGLWVALLTGFGWFVGQTLDTLEAGDGAASEAWTQMKGLWSEHKGMIYLCVGLPLLILVAAYVYRQRRSPKKTETSEVEPAAPISSERN